MDVKKLEWEMIQKEFSLKPSPLPAHDLFAGITEVMASPIDHMKSRPDAGPEVGMKFDQGKADLSLVPLIAIESEARALGFGEKKYGRYNYTAGFEVSRLTSATLRHLLAYNGGETFDPESGIHHIGHARANLAMLLHCEQLGTLRDNRFRGK
jgi:hypothetical protein